MKLSDLPVVELSDPHVALTLKPPTDALELANGTRLWFIKDADSDGIALMAYGFPPRELRDRVKSEYRGKELPWPVWVYDADNNEAGAVNTPLFFHIGDVR